MLEDIERFVGVKWYFQTGEIERETTIKTNNISNESTGHVKRPISCEEVYARAGLICRIARDHGLSYEQAQDVVQEVVIKCIKNPKVLYDSQKGGLNAYLGRIARNTAVDMWRKDRRNMLYFESEEVERRVDNHYLEIDYYDSMMEQRYAEWLEAGLEELYRRYAPKQANDAFIMVFRDGLPVRDVAKKLRVKEAYVRRAYARGKQQLALIVRRYEREIDFC